MKPVDTDVEDRDPPVFKFFIFIADVVSLEHASTFIEFYDNCLGKAEDYHAIDDLQGGLFSGRVWVPGRGLFGPERFFDGRDFLRNQAVESFFK